MDSTSQLLLDSGGQYDCGTTDITRTMHFGTPSDHQKRCFTAVLKGHIALDSCAPHRSHFPISADVTSACTGRKVSCYSSTECNPTEYSRNDDDSYEDY